MSLCLQLRFVPFIFPTRSDYAREKHACNVPGNSPLSFQLLKLTSHAWNYWESCDKHHHVSCNVVETLSSLFKLCTLCCVDVLVRNSCDTPLLVLWTNVYNCEWSIIEWNTLHAASVDIHVWYPKYVMQHSFFSSQPLYVYSSHHPLSLLHAHLACALLICTILTFFPLVSSYCSFLMYLT